MKYAAVLFLIGFTAAGLAFPGSPLYAQEVSLRAGGRTGLNFGWFSGDDWENSIDSRDGDNGIALGTTLGLFLEFGISDRFAVQPELLVGNLRGRYSYEEDISGDDRSVLINLRVLEIPVLAKGRLPVGPGSIYGVAGPDLMFVLGDVDFETLTDNTRTIVYEGPDNRVLFGFAIGAGYERPVGPGTLSGEIRYTRVLSGFEDNFDAFPNAIGVTVGFALDL